MDHDGRVMMLGHYFHRGAAAAHFGGWLRRSMRQPSSLTISDGGARPRTEYNIVELLAALLSLGGCGFKSHYRSGLSELPRWWYIYIYIYIVVPREKKSANAPSELYDGRRTLRTTICHVRVGPWGLDGSLQ